MKTIRRLAIANRGEVAVRIQRACQDLGIKTILLHSEPDFRSRAARLADQCVCIGPAESAQSYLHISRNVEAAMAAGADAVHPGFGFLSENAEFARAVNAAGMIFVGPSPEAIELLGDKVAAKRLAESMQVPTIPGYQGDNQDVSFLVERATDMGFPVIVKAAAGGGGRGMKVIRSQAEAAELIESAQREALAGFGSARVFLEKYLDRAKHIEVQIFGMASGQVMHLFDRECSVQRRHQKIIEEATAARLSDSARAKVLDYAVKMAQGARYRNAGTAEFLVQDEDVYFLEINTRLQVEHPVTEEVMGVDLVKAQLLTAQGMDPAWGGIRGPRGHSIECRLYAEDPYQGGMPSTGPLLAVQFPEGPRRRFEFGLEAGDEVTPFYDPMIAKVVVWDENRPRAIQKMLRTLEDTVILGVKTNIPFLRAILAHPEFVSGEMTTQFIGAHFAQGLPPRVLTDREKCVLEAAQNEASFEALGGTGSRSGLPDPWRSATWDSPGGGR